MQSRFLILIFLCFSYSCFMVKPGAVKSSKQLYETFYVGEGYTQYFIKPIEYESINDRLYLDVVFKYKSNVDELINSDVKFSILSEDIYKSIEKIELKHNEGFETTIEDVKLLFNEKEDNEVISRFSFETGLVDVKSFFSNPDQNIILTTKDGKELTFSTTEKTSGLVEKLRDDVFILID